MKKNSLFVIALLGFFIACQSEESLRHDILLKEEGFKQCDSGHSHLWSLKLREARFQRVLNPNHTITWKGKQYDIISIQNHNGLVELVIRETMDSLIGDLIKQYDNYATKYPKDSMTPTYLIREGQLYSSKRDYQKAAELFNKVCVQYSSDRWASYALFFQALAYSDWAQSNQNAVDVQKNVARSKSLFADFLKKYPTHSLVKDATNLMEMVGLSDEEMLQRAIQNRVADSIAMASQEKVKLQ
jgi:tetratricopeptide (TPR) repeat protein